MILNGMTDLADELIPSKKTPYDGVCKIGEIVLDAALSEKYGKNPGRYVTLETDVIKSYDYGAFGRLASALAGQIVKLSVDLSSVLIVGLGNPLMVADTLGVKVCEKINTVSNRKKTLCPNVVGVTGIESYDVISGVVKRLSPTAVIAIDSLAAATVQRMAGVVQLCDAGITPGSGVSNHKTTLDKSSLGVEVISIGVPLVVYASTIARDSGGKNAFDNMIVTPKDIDALVSMSAEIVAEAINLA